LCAFSDTLILDEDGIYDPNHFNDRLLLGLKGAMSEAELHILRARLRGGALNKVRRGEFRTCLPIGFLYDQQGHVILDPDQQVQHTLKLFFEVFRRVGSAFGTLKAFEKDRLLFPRRPLSGSHKGELVWGALSYNKVWRTLHNPRYAGAYCYGRTRVRRGRDGSSSSYAVPREEWVVCIPGAHPGYITWAEYEQNIQRLKENAPARGGEHRRTPPREGPALLQGIVMCGKCGHRMTVQYKYRAQGRVKPAYQCQRSRIDRGAQNCQYISGSYVDKAIEELILNSLSAFSLEVALEVHQEIQRRADETDRIRRQQVERAEYEADLAQRRYLRVDPDNRLVAGTLEAAWNQKLRALRVAQQQYEKQRQADAMLLSDEERQKVRSLVCDFPSLWKNPNTPMREKKRMIRLLIEDVTLIKDDQIGIHVRFKGGVHKSLSIPLPRKGWRHAMTDPKVVELIDEMLNDYNYGEIATILNEQGYTSGTGLSFNGSLIADIRRNYNLKTRYDRLRSSGKLTIQELTELLGGDKRTVRKLKKQGVLKAYPYNAHNECLYDYPDTQQLVCD
jgi:hypothetical protein